MTPVWLKPEQWITVTAPLRGSPASRSAELLFRIVAQFVVADAARFRSFVDPRTNRLVTFCNIYSWDLTSALGAEIPHWVIVDGKRVELNANATLGWLTKSGPAAGWRAADEIAARANANQGRPSVGVWANPTGGPGHIALLVPRRLGAPDVTFITQAGKNNFAYGLLSVGFGTKPVSFFTHD